MKEYFRLGTNKEDIYNAISIYERFIQKSH